MFMHTRLFHVLQRRYVSMWNDLRQANKAILCQTGHKNPDLQREGGERDWELGALSLCFAAGSVNIWTRSSPPLSTPQMRQCWLSWLAGFSILSMFLKRWRSLVRCCCRTCIPTFENKQVSRRYNNKNEETVNENRGTISISQSTLVRLFRKIFYAFSSHPSSHFHHSSTLLYQTSQQETPLNVIHHHFLPIALVYLFTCCCLLKEINAQQAKLHVCFFC